MLHRFLRTSWRWLAPRTILYSRVKARLTSHHLLLLASSDSMDHSHLKVLIEMRKTLKAKIQVLRTIFLMQQQLEVLIWNLNHLLVNNHQSNSSSPSQWRRETTKTRRLRKLTINLTVLRTIANSNRSAWNSMMRESTLSIRTSSRTKLFPYTSLSTKKTQKRVKLW